jgi:hypothetical protein
MQRVCLTCTVLAALIACSSRTRLAPEAPLPDAIDPSDYAGSLVVPYPPPPAKVETMPPAPTNPACVYLDGQWTFGSRDWQWVAGAWVIAPGGCAFVRQRLFWLALGSEGSELRFRPGRWVQTSNNALDCPVATACPGASVITP